MSNHARPKTSKTSFDITPEVNAALDNLAARTGIKKTAIIAAIVTDALQNKTDEEFMETVRRVRTAQQQKGSEYA